MDGAPFVLLNMLVYGKRFNVSKQPPRAEGAARDDAGAGADLAAEQQTCHGAVQASAAQSGPLCGEQAVRASAACLLTFLYMAVHTSHPQFNEHLARVGRTHVCQANHMRHHRQPAGTAGPSKESATSQANVTAGPK